MRSWFAVVQLAMAILMRGAQMFIHMCDWTYELALQNQATQKWCPVFHGNPLGL